MQARSSKGNEGEWGLVGLRPWSVLLPLLVCLGCGGLRGSLFVPLPAEASGYSTAAGADGVVGGEAAKDAADLLVAYLGERGDHAEPDGALSAAAAWILQGAYAGENRLDSRAVEATAQRYGFAGLVLGAVVSSLNNQDSVVTIEQIVAQLPSNQRVTRYGVRGAPGRNVAIVIGTVEVELAEFPRSVEPGGVVGLSGAVSARYERASVFVRDPSGEVRELPQQGREVQATLRLAARGVHQIEVMGYGTSGPVVLMNVPISVGRTELGDRSARATAEDPNLTSERAEASLLTLLNASRREHGLGVLVADDELRAIALGHSQDMDRHRFFGHVSPTTGTLDDRVRRAEAHLSKAAECVGMESTPEGAHVGLMQSPAHRVAMLDADFTHVGIGVAFRHTETGKRALIATLVLGRRPPPQAARKTATEVLEAIQGFRKTRRVGAVRDDPVLTLAAAAAIRSLKESPVDDPKRALAEAEAELARQVGASSRGAPTCFVLLDMLELRQLSQSEPLLQADLTSLGVAVLELTDRHGPRLVVALAMQSKPGKTLICR